VISPQCFLLPFFFNDTPTTAIYTLSLHDALPIYHFLQCDNIKIFQGGGYKINFSFSPGFSKILQIPGGNFYLSNKGIAQEQDQRSEEHTSELQSRENLVCRLLLEKKKKNNSIHTT